MDKSSYTLSNQVIEVRRNRLSSAYGKNVLSCGESALERLKRGQELLDYLCDIFGINRVELKVYNSKQPKCRNGHICGHYSNFGEIVIYNHTAIRGQVVSIKGFYDTLLHEFIHHYDYKVLKLTESLHTKGFYMRISDLKRKLF